MPLEIALAGGRCCWRDTLTSVSLGIGAPSAKQRPSYAAAAVVT